ncbi:MAG: amidase [Candidatus Heimdallarchaeota archaeon]
MKEYSISEIQKLMAEGKLTAKQLVKKYLERINKIDKSGPKINSIIELNPDALKIAENLDQVRKEDNSLGPLHGIPILIKDNITTADNMMTTAGSLALEGFRSTRDAFIVQKLRAAGAIILGKTNLSEWANFRSTRSTSGWSSRGGQARNPYVLDRSPCGSSSGSATAVAANLCSVSIGTETDGSIVCPAHVNSVVGVKPSIGLVSRTGIIPISHNQDTAGPIARTVEDAAILLTAMVGVDKEDAQSITNEKDIPADYTEFLDSDGLKDARIGVARNFFGRNELVNQVIDKAIEKMEKAGAIIVDQLMLDSVKKLREPEYEVLLYDFKNDLNEFLEIFVPNEFPQTMKEIIDFNEKNKEKVMPYFGQEHFKKAEERGPLTDKVYKKALKDCHKYAREEGIDLAIKENKLDAIIAPTGGPAWPMDLVNGDHFTGGSSSLAAVAGYANITVPVGYVFGLPVGLSFFGGAFQEPILLKIAYAFEQLTKVRKPPSYLETLKI